MSYTPIDNTNTVNLSFNSRNFSFTSLSYDPPPLLGRSRSLNISPIPEISIGSTPSSGMSTRSATPTENLMTISEECESHLFGKTILSLESFKREMLELFEVEMNFKEKSERILELIVENIPDEFAKFYKFVSLHLDKIETISKKGWKGLKGANSPRELMKSSSQPNDISYEDFRRQMVDEMNNLSIATLNAMGYPNLKHNAFGTKGPDSDIDTVLEAPRTMPQEVQMMEKFLFDITCYQVFKDFPGKMLDSESYVQSLAKTMNTEAMLSTETGQKGFSYLETLAAELQEYQRLSPYPGEWEKHKQNQFNIIQAHTKNNSNKKINEYNTSLNQVYKDIEEFEKDLLKGFKSQLAKEGLNWDSASTEQRKLAEMSYKIPKLMRLSIQMDSNQEILRGLLVSLDKSSQSQKKVLQTQIDKMELEIAIFGMIRDRVACDEGYLTQGALLVTVLAGESAQVIQSRKDEIRGKLKNQYITGEYPKSEGKRISFSLLKPAGNPTSLALASSIQENLYMYDGHTRALIDGPKKAFYNTLKGRQEALLQHAKYAKRVGYGIKELLNILNDRLTKSNEENNKNQLELKSRIECSLKKCSDFEKLTNNLLACKRKNQIPLDLAYNRLKGALDGDEGAAKRIIDVVSKVEEELDFSVLTPEKLGLIYSRLMSLNKDGKTRTKYEDPFLFFSYLKNLNVYRIFKIRGDEERTVSREQSDLIQAILTIRCGTYSDAFTSSDKTIELAEEVFDAAKEEMMKTSFYSKKVIEQFDSELATLSIQSKLLSIEAGMIPIPSIQESLSINFVWNKA